MVRSVRKLALNHVMCRQLLPADRWALKYWISECDQCQMEISDTTVNKLEAR